MLPRERPCSLALLALHALATAAAVLQRSHGPPASGMQHALGQMCCVSERGGAVRRVHVLADAMCVWSMRVEEASSSLLPYMALNERPRPSFARQHAK